MNVTNIITGGDGEPCEPDWNSVYTDELDIAAARTEWGLVVRELRDNQTLAVANGHSIRRLIDFRIQYERAIRHVAEHGPVFPPRGRARAGQWNPYWSVMRHCDEAIRTLEAELGLAPTRRKKASKVVRKERTARASDAYLKKPTGK